MRLLLVNKTFLLLFCLSAAEFNYSQTVLISGTIRDSATGESMVNATVYEKLNKIGAISNEFGYFNIAIPKGKAEIVFSYVGYKPTVFIHDFKNDTSIKILLNGIYLIEEIKVIGSSRSKISDRNEMSTLYIPITQIKLLPTLFGEADILKTLQHMPGIQSGGESKTDLNVRGGSNDQNLILLDNIPLYYVSHFAGLLSTFNPDAINDFKLYKGGFPARYGGRLSSVLDVRMKDGNINKLQGQGTLGLISSKLSIEGPIVKGKASYFVSFRKNVLPIFKVFTDLNIDYNFYDFYAKMKFRINEKNTIYSSFYSGDDKVKTVEQEMDAESSFDNETFNKWGNIAASVYWNHIFNPKLFSNIVLGYSQYHNSRGFSQEIVIDTLTRRADSRYRSAINDIILNSSFDYYLNNKIKTRFGFNSSYHAFLPGIIDYSQKGSNTISIDTTNNFFQVQAWDVALFAENDMKLFKWLNCNVGLRFSDYFTSHLNFVSIEPRILFNIKITPDFSVKTSYSQMTQYVHFISLSGIGMPSDYWLPSVEGVAPETSSQIDLGIAWSMFKNKLELSIESYYKKMENIIAFKQGESFFNFKDSWEDKIETGGLGISKGIEFLLQKPEGKTTGWIGFTFSNAKRRFNHLNNNDYFLYRYDRKIDIELVLVQEVSKRISFSSTWSYGTGYPITIPLAKYFSFENEIYIYNYVNSFRMRDYHRLDIGINYSHKIRSGLGIINLSIFNLYNRKNPYYYYFEREKIIKFEQEGGGGHIYTTDGDMNIYQQSLFPFFPSFSYSIKF